MAMPQRVELEHRRRRLKEIQFGDVELESSARRTVRSQAYATRSQLLSLHPGTS